MAKGSLSIPLGVNFQNLLNCSLDKESERKLSSEEMCNANTLLLWAKLLSVNNLRRHMQFLHEEAKELSIPTTAELSQWSNILILFNSLPHVSIAVTTHRALSIPYLAYISWYTQVPTVWITIYVSRLSLSEIHSGGGATSNLMLSWLAGHLWCKCDLILFLLGVGSARWHWKR